MDSGFILKSIDYNLEVLKSLQPKARVSSTNLTIFHKTRSSVYNIYTILSVASIWFKDFVYKIWFFFTFFQEWRREKLTFEKQHGRSQVENLHQGKKWSGTRGWTCSKGLSIQTSGKLNFSIIFRYFDYLFSELYDFFFETDFAKFNIYVDGNEIYLY